MDESLDKRAHAQLMFDQRADHLKYLPAQILFDLARNEAADRNWRKAATELLIEKNYTQAHHPDLAILVMEIQAEHTAKHDVQAVVESAIEGEIPDAFTASVTTSSLQREEAINNIARNPQALGDDALGDSPSNELPKGFFAWGR